jgi:hypothetical protein
MDEKPRIVAYKLGSLKLELKLQEVFGGGPLNGVRASGACQSYFAAPALVK